ncbi:Ribosomal large subunit pseudouridine synthase D [compost metagenome]
MKFIGHPLVGDPVYGRSKGITMGGQALHAAILGFVHPTTGEYMEYSRPIPADMEDLLLQLRSR